MGPSRVQTPLVCHGHERPIVDLAYSPVTPDGTFLTSASKDGSPMLRNGATGDWIGTFQGHKGAVWSCILNDPAMLAATASADFSARVWNALTGDQLHSFTHGHIVRTLQFMHHSPKLITAGYEQLIRLYDLAKPEEPPQEVAGAPDKIRCACLHPNDHLLLTSFVNKPSISVWDVRSASIVRQLDTSAIVTSIEVQPDGSRFTTADGRDVRVWDGDALEVVKHHTLGYDVESASLCPVKRRLAAGGDNMWVYLHDYDSGAELECNKGHHGPVHCIRFSPDGESYASGSEDGTIRIWETDFATKELQSSDGAAAATANGQA